MRAVVLNPPSYSCPDDHSDLTGLVTQELSGDGLAVARFARAAFRLPVRRRSPLPAQPFEVIVTCPAADHPRPHQLTCTGTYQPSVNGSRVPPVSSTQTALVWVYSCTAAMPFSRPSPCIPKPPNGTSGPTTR